MFQGLINRKLRRDSFVSSQTGFAGRVWHVAKSKRKRRGGARPANVSILNGAFSTSTVSFLVCRPRAAHRAASLLRAGLEEVREQGCGAMRHQALCGCSFGSLWPRERDSRVFCILYRIQNTCTEYVSYFCSRNYRVRNPHLCNITRRSTCLSQCGGLDRSGDDG